MGKPIVDTCCCDCCDLETGGKVIAWIFMIIYGLVMGILLCIMIALLFIPCNYDDDHMLIDIDICSYGKFGVIIFLLLGCGIFATFFIIYLVLLNGCNDHSPGKVLPALIFTGISVASDLIFCAKGVFLLGTLLLALNIYIFIVLLSLYMKFDEERHPGGNVIQHASPGLATQIYATQNPYPGMAGQPYVVQYATPVMAGQSYVVQYASPRMPVQPYAPQQPPQNMTGQPYAPQYSPQDITGQSYATKEKSEMH